jgi:CheY-like chemotaxis protein
MPRGKAVERIHSRHVLIVDDDVELRRDLCGVLAEAGVPVVAAGDGADALAYLRGAPLKPGLIVLDLMMPGMDGLTFARALAKDRALASIPILVLSGASVPIPPEVNVADRLTKPIEADDFISAVHRHALL